MGKEFVCSFNKDVTIKNLSKLEDTNAKIASLYGGYSERLKLEVLAEGLFSFAKFKEGDIVYFVKDIECTGGWASSKHFLIAGNSATVQSVNFNCYLIDDVKIFQFQYNVIPQGQTWISSHRIDGLNTEVHNMIEPHAFNIYESQLTEAFYKSDWRPSVLWREKNSNGFIYELGSFLNDEGILTTKVRFLEGEWATKIGLKEPNKCDCCGQLIK
jgi:hypothetical protein